MKKKGFGLPMTTWMHTKMKPLVIKKLNRLKKRDIFDAQCVDKLIQGFYNNGEPYQKLFFLVSFELWMEQFIDSSHTEI
jgi:hypothetical protein